MAMATNLAAPGAQAASELYGCSTAKMRSPPWSQTKGTL
jgi:hypothetical protein